MIRDILAMTFAVSAVASPCFLAFGIASAMMNGVRDSLLFPFAATSAALGCLATASLYVVNNAL